MPDQLTRARFSRRTPDGALGVGVQAEGVDVTRVTTARAGCFHVPSRAPHGELDNAMTSVQPGFERVQKLLVSDATRVVQSF